MPILSIKHVTIYRYHQPVAFGEHRMMLRPRDDHDQRVIETELKITPRPERLDWSRDKFGNHVATAAFTAQAAELCFISTIRLDHAPADFDRASIAGYARICPFRYRPKDLGRLKRYLRVPTSQAAVERWSAGFFGADGSADTHDLLRGMTETICRTFDHRARHEEGTRSPQKTLRLGSGSCRDLAMLLIAILRSRGLAARFVSGYLHLDDDDDDTSGGNTHAWVQVYVPGPGWIDLDPSAGVVGNRNRVRVAVVPHPRAAVPLQGVWFGRAEDHLAMDVAVKVKAAAGPGVCKECE